MAVPFSNTKQRLPPGFRNLLEAFAKEAIRTQPENVIEFGAQFFEALLADREQTGRDLAKIGASLEDRFYNIPFERAEVEEPEKFEAARRIQTEFRRFHAKKEVEVMREEVATARVQAGMLGYVERHTQREPPVAESPPLLDNEERSFTPQAQPAEDGEEETNEADQDDTDGQFEFVDQQELLQEAGEAIELPSEVTGETQEVTGEFSGLEPESTEGYELRETSAEEAEAPVQEVTMQEDVANIQVEIADEEVAENDELDGNMRPEETGVAEADAEAAEPADEEAAAEGDAGVEQEQPENNALAPDDADAAADGENEEPSDEVAPADENVANEEPSDEAVPQDGDASLPADSGEEPQTAELQEAAEAEQEDQVEGEAQNQEGEAPEAEAVAEAEADAEPEEQEQ